MELSVSKGLVLIQENYLFSNAGLSEMGSEVGSWIELPQNGVQ